MINDPAQPEGAKEARDSEADTSSIDTILQNSLENTAQHTHYPSISEIEERICAEMKAIKAAKEAKKAKEPKEADEIKKAISLYTDLKGLELSGVSWIKTKQNMIFKPHLHNERHAPHPHTHTAIIRIVSHATL